MLLLPRGIAAGSFQPLILRSDVFHAFLCPMRAHDTGWMGCPEVAGRLGVSLRTVYGMINRGDLPAYHMGRVIRVRRTDLQSFLLAQRLKPGDLDHLLSGGGSSAAAGPPSAAEGGPRPADPPD